MELGHLALEAREGREAEERTLKRGHEQHRGVVERLHQPAEKDAAAREPLALEAERGAKEHLACDVAHHRQERRRALAPRGARERVVDNLAHRLGVDAGAVR